MLPTHLSACLRRLNSKLEALDYDVERAAEEELFQGAGSLAEGSSLVDGSHSYDGQD